MTRKPQTGRYAARAIRSPVFCLSLVPAAMAREAAAAADSGVTYQQVCYICHKAGLNAAPKYGNKILWGRVVEQGRAEVYNNAINGLRAVPPRGRRVTLTDEEVKATVYYMVESSGGWKD